MATSGFPEVGGAHVCTHVHTCAHMCTRVHPRVHPLHHPPQLYRCAVQLRHGTARHGTACRAVPQLWVEGFTGIPPLCGGVQERDVILWGFSPPRRESSALADGSRHSGENHLKPPYESRVFLLVLLGFPRNPEQSSGLMLPGRPTRAGFDETARFARHFSFSGERSRKNHLFPPRKSEF